MCNLICWNTPDIVRARSNVVCSTHTHTNTHTTHTLTYIMSCEDHLMCHIWTRLGRWWWWWQRWCTNNSSYIYRIMVAFSNGLELRILMFFIGISTFRNECFWKICRYTQLTTFQTTFHHHAHMEWMRKTGSSGIYMRTLLVCYWITKPNFDVMYSTHHIFQTSNQIALIQLSQTEASCGGCFFSWLRHLFVCLLRLRAKRRIYLLCVEMTVSLLRNNDGCNKSNIWSNKMFTLRIYSYLVYIHMQNNPSLIIILNSKPVLCK